MSQKKRQPNSPDADTGHATGPTSIQGLEASELDKIDPEGERGSVDTDPRRIAARKLPAQTGESSAGDVGTRAMPGSADANEHGHRKHN
jgi:hypothetical protein